MEDKYAALIEKLADKLGTTAEHLYGVLVAQAPISAAIEVITAAAMCAIFFALFKALRRVTAIPPATEEERYPRAIVSDEAAISMMWLGLVVFGLFTLGAVFCAFNTAVTALVNPEYWAISQLTK